MDDGVERLGIHADGRGRAEGVVELALNLTPLCDILKPRQRGWEG